jgi:hypothetical protein
MKNLSLQGSNEPSAFITVNKQRVKQYEPSIVYLKNGQEFELELFNPLQVKVLAKIELNGISIGNGVVIKPGQRAYLERFIDDAKKFLFETYDIDANDSQAVQAAMKNGFVKIQFYPETTFIPTYNSGIRYYTSPTPTIWFDGSTSGSINISGSNTTTNAFYCGNATYTNTSGITSVTTSASGEWDGTMTCSDTSASYQVTNSMETGRVEKGNHSNQSFSYDYSSYNWAPCNTIEWTILPESRKVIEPSNIVTYCSNCGAKRKKQNHKFCPHCGTKF